jgi:ribosomal protein L31
MDEALTEDAEIEKVNPLEHTFADGMYIRKIVMPAGQLIISKIHKQQHPFFILSGDVSVMTENGVVRYNKPFNGITEVGTQRILYTHAETTWITVQRTDETDVEKIVNTLTAKDFNDPELSTETINELLGGNQ